MTPAEKYLEENPPKPVTRTEVEELAIKWFKEWNTLCAERDKLPLNHADRKTLERVCDTLAMVLCDVHVVLGVRKA